MLLASLIVMQEKLAALSRGDIPEEKRVMHFLFAEEAQTYIGDFEVILSERMKFNLASSVATKDTLLLTACRTNWLILMRSAFSMIWQTTLPLRAIAPMTAILVLIPLTWHFLSQ